MKEKGKSVEYSDHHLDYYNYSSSDLPCKKHPSSSSVGICAYCLKDRLIKLVCSDCGEQRLSSCSCSDISSSYRNSSCTVDVGSVGRISFLIENEKTDQTLLSLPKLLKKRERMEDVVVLKRSNSCCVEVKKSNNGFWRLGRLFRRKRERVSSERRSVGGGFDERSEMWVSDCLDVSRSRSLCSFRGSVGNFNDYPDHEGSDIAYSSAKISDFNETEPRKSGFERGFPVKESVFSGMDHESGFIDLKLDLSSKTEYSVLEQSTLFLGHIENGGSFESGSNGGSCRITVNERGGGIKKGGKKNHNKVWKWIFKYHPGRRSSASKKDFNHILESERERERVDR